MSGYSVRRFRNSDAGFVSEMENRCFSTPMPWEYIASIPQKENTIFVVCEDDDGRLAGYAGMMWVLDEGSVISIAVEDKHRNEGLGSLLMQALKEYALDLELSSLTLELRSSNLPAKRLYEKNGFSVCGNMKNYYSYPKEDAIIMTCYF